MNPRIWHASATIIDTITNTLLPIVTGGYDGNYMDTTEILIDNQWQPGPSLPKAMRGLSMITIDNDGFVFGGYDGGYNKEVFKISCANKNCQWSTTDKVLDNGRLDTVAIPISPTLCKLTTTTTTKP